MFNKVILVIFFFLPFSCFSDDIFRDNSLNTSSVPITLSSQPTQDTVIYSVEVSPILENTMVKIDGQAQVTTDCYPNVGLGRYIVRSTTPTSCSSGAKRLAPAVMDNFNRTGLHHKGFNVHATDFLENSLTHTYYNLCVKAITTSCSSLNITVDNQGRLDAIVQNDGVNTLNIDP